MRGLDIAGAGLAAGTGWVMADVVAVPGLEGISGLTIGGLLALCIWMLQLQAKAALEQERRNGEERVQEATEFADRLQAIYASNKADLDRVYAEQAEISRRFVDGMFARWPVDVKPTRRNLEREADE